MPAEAKQLDDTIEIVTPENIAFDYRVAGPLRRFLAYLIDFALRVGVFFLLTAIVCFSGAIVGDLLVVFLFVAFFIIYWLYGGLFETFMNGQTPGKRLLGIRVLTTEGRPINGMQAMVRNLLRYVDECPYVSPAAFPFLDDLWVEPWTHHLAAIYIIPTFVMGLVVMASNRRFQRLGDLVCGTMVAIEERHWLTTSIKLEDPRAAQLAEYIPANFVVTRTMARAIAAYADRRRFFSPARRREVARHLAEPLLNLFQLPADTSHDLLLCALYHRTFVLQKADEKQGQPRPLAVAAPPNAAAAPIYIR